MRWGQIIQLYKNTFVNLNRMVVLVFQTSDVIIGRLTSLRVWQNPPLLGFLWSRQPVRGPLSWPYWIVPPRLANVYIKGTLWYTTQWKFGIRSKHIWESQICIQTHQSAIIMLSNPVFVWWRERGVRSWHLMSFEYSRTKYNLPASLFFPLLTH